MTAPDCPFVSRGGLKLAAALEAFALDVRGLICADLGASTGGFVDCLLRHGAAHVFAVDTAYGQLAWQLRQDPRVTVLERTNALHFEPGHGLIDAGFTGCELVSIDLGWTPQRHAIPAALRWLTRQRPDAARIISLIKPQYEAAPAQVRGRRAGILNDADGQAIVQRVIAELPALGVEVLGCISSPIRGSVAGGKPGNLEYLALLKPLAAAPPTDDAAHAACGLAS